MKRIALIFLAGVASCGLFTGPDRDGPPAQLTGLPRALTADEARVSTVANHFALTLFKRLSAVEPAKNVFVSPLSVSFALGMTMNGATGATFTEMRSTLGFGADDLTAINAGYRGLLSLESGLDPSTTFQIANSVWHRTTLPVSPFFIDAMHQTFDADVKPAPFDATTLAAVNSWVSQKTSGKIPTILEQISPDDVMFLVNAIYFKGSWRDQFDVTKTVSAAFNAVGGAQQVKTMNRVDGEGKLRYYRSATATVGELAYGNGAFVMTVVVPTGDVDAFAATLDTASWRALLAPMVEADYAVRLPKFKLEYEQELKDDLQALGMQTPFVPNGADFTAMSSAGKQLFIAFVKHKTFVDVNEAGTEAAAVTAVGIQQTSLPPCLCVDRPFLFAIRERFSGTILFMGKIVRIPD
jgi:serpin B